MATLRNKRKIAAVSRETPESTRNSRGQSTIDPDLTQDYISQVAEEIEGRVTKKLSEESSRTESRILGALSKLDEFLLNPQVRTLFRSSSGNIQEQVFRKPENHWDRCSDDPCPEARSFSRHSGQINSPEAEINPHNYSGNCDWFRLIHTGDTSATPDVFQVLVTETQIPKLLIQQLQQILIK